MDIELYLDEQTGFLKDDIYKKLMKFGCKTITINNKINLLFPRGINIKDKQQEMKRLSLPVPFELLVFYGDCYHQLN